MKQKNDTKKLAIGATLAAAAGFLAGILAAPKSGKETRNSIKKAGSKSIDEVETQFHKVEAQLGDTLSDAKAQAGKLSGQAKDELTAASEKAKLAKDKAAEVFSSIRSGEAEDKDLQKAVDGAKKSLEHLRSYLKK